MKSILAVAVLVLVGLVSSTPLAAAELTAASAAAVEQEIRSALLAEQRALTSGGCDAALAFFAEREPLFVSNGKTMATKAAVRSSCGATMPSGAPRRELQGHQVHVLSPVAGYSVTTYRFKSGSTQVVTKIWEKGDTGWRIVHSHISETSR